MRTVIFKLCLVHQAPPDSWGFTRLAEALRPFKVDMCAVGSQDRLTAEKRFPSVLSAAEPYVIPAVSPNAFKFDKSAEEIDVKDGKGVITKTPSSTIPVIILSILSGHNDSQYVQATLDQFEPGTFFFGVRDSLGRDMPATSTSVSNITSTTFVQLEVQGWALRCVCV